MYSLFFDVFVCLLGIICILKMKVSDRNRYATLFFVIGAVSSYLGYWSFPLITLTFPLCIYIISSDSEKLFADIFYYSIMWSIGIVTTVIIKMLFSFYLFGDVSGTHHISEWIGNLQISERVNTVISFYLRDLSLGVLSSNSIRLYVIVCLILSLYYRLPIKTVKIENCKIKMLSVMMLFPIVWECIFTVHGYHGFVRFMNSSIVFCILVLILQYLETNYYKRISQD